MHDLSLILGCMRSVNYCLNKLVLLEKMLLVMFYIVSIVRLTLGIGNFKSSHFLSAGHVPLGLGRDKVGIRALAQFMHFRF